MKDILDDLAEAGLLLNMEHQNGRYRFRFKNQMIKECLWESGSILELYIFREARMQCDDSCIGGILHAFYELETITRRFGGKYARKVLVTAKPLGKTYQERAKEMKIEIQTVEK